MTQSTDRDDLTFDEIIANYDDAPPLPLTFWRLLGKYTQPSAESEAA